MKSGQEGERGRECRVIPLGWPQKQFVPPRWRERKRQRREKREREREGEKEEGGKKEDRGRKRKNEPDNQADWRWLGGGGGAAGGAGLHRRTIAMGVEEGGG